MRAKKPFRQLVGVTFYTITGSRHAAEREVPVHGGGIMDMCRYDTAFVPTDGRNVVAFPSLFIRGGGHYGGQPTLARWASFMLRLEQCDRPADWQDTRPRDASAWVTYKHPKMDGPYSATDYGRLVAVTLADYLAEVER